MAYLLRAILTFKNPTTPELLHLNNLIWVGTTNLDQKIYVASPSTNLIRYSEDRIQNLKTLNHLLYTGGIDSFKNKV